MQQVGYNVNNFLARSCSSLDRNIILKTSRGKIIIAKGSEKWMNELSVNQYFRENRKHSVTKKKGRIKMFEFVLITFIACTVSEVYCSRYERLEGRLDVMERKQFHDSVSFRTDIKLLFDKLSNISNDKSSADFFGLLETKQTEEYVTRLEGVMKTMKRSFQEEKQHSRELFDHIKVRVKRQEELCSRSVKSIKNVLKDGLEEIQTKHFQMISRLQDIDSVLQILTSQQQKTKALSENILAKMELLHENLHPVSKEPLCGIWQHFNKSCYYLGKEAVTFDGANKICEIMNAYLVEIETDENKFPTGLAENEKTALKGYGLWVGGTDRENEGVWIWNRSKRIIDFSSWHSNEPNGGKTVYTCTTGTHGCGMMQDVYSRCLTFVRKICDFTEDGEQFSTHFTTDC